jgi:hypothetical protein
MSIRQPRRSRAERMREVAEHHREIASHHSALMDLYYEEADRLEEDFDEE